MQTSADIGELAKALAAAQAEMGGAIKDSANPFFKSKYADLASVRDACIPALAKQQIGVVQSPEVVTDERGILVSVETRLIHSSGQWVSGLISALPKDMTPQAVGSTITYLRRYALQSFAGVAPEDDDGEAAQGRSHRPSEAAKMQAVPRDTNPFNEWVADLEATADEGSAKLLAVWNKSQPTFKKALDPKQWDAIKAKAAKVPETVF